MIKTILFDLDGTLLPMDQEQFIKNYFIMIQERFIKKGYNGKKIMDAVYQGTNAMIKNNGLSSNETVFWKTFMELVKGSQEFFELEFNEFYLNEFDFTKDCVRPNNKVKEIIKKLKDKNIKLVLATNPLFPKVATEKRIIWAGLDKDDFIHITTYENASYAKPNLNYFNEILVKNNLNPKECLMVGNDATEDMCVNELGIKSYLVTDCLINEKDVDINEYQNGTLSDFCNYIDKI